MGQEGVPGEEGWGRGLGLRGAAEKEVGLDWQHCLVKGSLELHPEEDEDSVTATWNFREEKSPPTIDPSGSAISPLQPLSVGVTRWGCMVVPRARQTVVEMVGRASKRKGGGSDGSGNLVHVALVGEEERWEGRGTFFEGRSSDKWFVHGSLEQLQISLLCGASARALKEAGVAAVSCLLPGKAGALSRYCFLWSDAQEAYLERPLLRNVEPTLAASLELVRVHSLPARLESPLGADVAWWCLSIEWSRWVRWSTPSPVTASGTCTSLLGRGRAAAKRSSSERWSATWKAQRPPGGQWKHA